MDAKDCHLFFKWQSFLNTKTLRATLPANHARISIFARKPARHFARLRRSGRCCLHFGVLFHLHQRGGTGSAQKQRQMNQPTKTILAWFEEARTAGHEWADAAIENCHEAGLADAHAKHLAIALSTAFVWARTTQGFEFWREIHADLPWIE